MPSGIDAALGKLGGLEPKKKEVPQEKASKPAAAVPTVDLMAEGLDGCRRRVEKQNAQIKELQDKLAGLPPTKASKPKKTELEKQIEELQKDPNYRGALKIVRDEDEKERDARRAQRDKEEEDMMLGIAKPTKNSGAQQPPPASKAAAATKSKAAEVEVDMSSFELDAEVAGVVTSAVEGSEDAQAKLAAGAGTISYASTVREEVASMAVRAVEKVAQSLKRAGLRDNSLKTVRALLWNPPAVLPSLPAVLVLLDEAKLKSEPGGSAVDLATKLSRPGPTGKAIPELVLPVLLAHLGAAAGGKWKVKVGTIGILKATLTAMQEPGATPWQLGLVMPQVTKALRDAVGDARKEVKKSAEELLLHIARDMVHTPEISKLAEELIGSIVDSANMQKAAEALQKLANTTFMNTVDAGSFALLFPIVCRAIREREHESKKKGVQIVGASVHLIASPEFLAPYLDELLPLLKECLMHPTHDVEREAAKTFGLLALGLPRLCEEDLYPYLLDKLQSASGLADESEVERRGAAHGLSEVLLQRRDLLSSCLYSTILPRISTGSTPETKAGACAILQFMPHHLGAGLLPHLEQIMPVLLEALREESEVVTKQAKAALELIMDEFAGAFPKLLLPHMQESLFFEEEDARDLAMQLFFYFCDKLQEAVKFGQDFMSVEVLPPTFRKSLVCSIFIARTDGNPAVRRVATLLWKERIQSGQKAKAEILPQLLQHLKALKQSGSEVRAASADACLADLRSSGDLEDSAAEAAEPLPFRSQKGAAPEDFMPKERELNAPISRKDLVRNRAKELLPKAAIPLPLRRYVEVVVLSCALEADGLEAAKKLAETELKPLVAPSESSALARLGLAGVLEKMFEGIEEPPAQAAGAGASADNGDSGDALVQVNNLMLMYGGGKVLLKDTRFELRKGHRYGVVGRNGVGKTTLMSTIASGGVAQIPKSIRSLHVRPEVLVESSDLTAVQFCRKHNPSDEHTEDALHAALDKVGFPAEMHEKAVQELSGGWRMKLLIASAMMRDCDILLLDEPTNHLDAASVEWLATYLCSLTETTAMVISHDPHFLNRCCTDIIHYAANQTLEYYAGNFDQFRKVRNITSDEEAEALLLGQDTSDFRKENNKEVDDAEDGEDIDGKDADVVDPEGVKSRLLDKASKISFPIPGKLAGHSTSRPVMELKDVWFTYDEEEPTWVIQNVSCKLNLSSRVGIVGANGAGKSTLLNLLCGELHSVAGPEQKEPGEVVRHRNLRLAYIAQQHMFHLGEFLNSSPYVYIQKRFKNGYDEALQERLINPATEEEAKARQEAAQRWGKYGKQVKTICGRQLRGKEILYEVEWADLDDPKQNTYEPVWKLKKLGMMGAAKAYDERMAAQAAGIHERPLSGKEIVKHFEQFGLDEEMVMNRNIGSFSAGQKSKTTLGAAFWIKPHVVALDEPTNYIDMETLDALAKALQRFKGAVIVISHSSSFVNSVCEEFWHVEENKVRRELKDKK
mmetsp:Transcript_67005/g.160565  ORF Transcript_67005/g.160565 Transcript_67005/m.160565 type:complete len:1485 (+) Transcript_67005:94-4548(+)|eukprot:CAMPEP_0178422150 /NCGR_PEP_ID=MMETSP0689_2-20121128/27023_1 /TAXON_ID=160604 /ORGANISM="Amphidinium massartii, Strain CS-259" /LENGTH=1484 /DNA_ID=CAMNT_0020043701 /DNA_START=14 /DNA_END=4468 /DNA_ORIENTATION=-